MNLYFADIGKKVNFSLFSISRLSEEEFLYHVSFNVMSSNIDIISADKSIFDDSAIFVMSF